jgi:hypothetical protein
VALFKKQKSREQFIRQIGMVYWHLRYNYKFTNIDLSIILMKSKSLYFLAMSHLKLWRVFFQKWNRFMEKQSLYIGHARERNLRVKSANSLAPPFTWMWVINILFYLSRLKLWKTCGANNSICSSTTNFVLANGGCPKWR